MGILDANRDDILYVYNYHDDIILFVVKSGYIIDMMKEGGEFDDLVIKPVSLWVSYEFGDNVLNVNYISYDGSMIGGGTWRYRGDYVQWFRDKKLVDIIGFGG
jgi:hypothetical protein